MALEEPRLGITMKFLDAGGPACPAGQVVGNNAVETGSLQDAAAIQRLAEGSTVVTTEIEHVNSEALIELEETSVNVQPSGRIIRLIQDKYLQKEHFRTSAIAVPDVLPVDGPDDLDAAMDLSLIHI